MRAGMERVASEREQVTRANGAQGRDRTIRLRPTATPDELSLGKSFGYGRTELDGAQGRDRTTDTAIFSRMLYQLSYLGISLRPWPGSAGL
jgi:hypothetical protein